MMMLRNLILFTPINVSPFNSEYRRMIFHKQECIPDLPGCGRVPACIRGMGREMSLMLFHRGFYTNLVRSAFVGNGVTAAGSLFTRFSHKALLFLPFGNHGVGALGDVVQLLLVFRADLFSNNAGASRPTETTTLTHSIALRLIPPSRISHTLEDADLNLQILRQAKTGRRLVIMSAPVATPNRGSRHAGVQLVGFTKLRTLAEFKTAKQAVGSLGSSRSSRSKRIVRKRIAKMIRS